MHAGDEVWEEVARRGSTEACNVCDGAVVVLGLIYAVLDALWKRVDELSLYQCDCES
jgi:hypothetical protein